MPQPAQPQQSQHEPGSFPWCQALAVKLEQQSATLQKQISANRSQLRNLVAMGACTAEQRRWVQVFYPEKQRGERRSAEDVEATRKARLAARKQAH